VGPGALEPLKPAEGFSPLVSCSVRDPVGGVVDSAAPIRLCGGTPEPWMLGTPASSPGSQRALEARPRIRLRLLSIGSLRLR
jgi:hypothetical protein